MATTVNLGGYLLIIVVILINSHLWEYHRLLLALSDSRSRPHDEHIYLILYITKISDTVFCKNLAIMIV